MKVRVMALAVGAMFLMVAAVQFNFAADETEPAKDEAASADSADKPAGVGTVDDADADEPAASDERAGGVEEEPASENGETETKTPADAGAAASDEPAAGTDDVRMWSDTTGAHKVEAAFMDAEIRLKKPDGTMVAILFAQLSDADKDYVRQKLGADGGDSDSPGDLPSVGEPAAEDSESRPATEGSAEEKPADTSTNGDEDKD